MKRLARSYLFAPGSHERLLQKVFAAGADAVVIDLEDAVAPEHKDLARRLVGRMLATRGSEATGPQVFVRINSVASGLWADDLEAVVTPGLDGVRLARTESVDEVRQVNDAIETLERARGLRRGELSIIPSVESAIAVLRAEQIASGPRVLALAFGASDFLHDVGAGAGANDVETLYARAHLVVVSRSARIAPPIANVHPRLSDLEALKQSSESARRLGFFGRSCIHPIQLPIVHDVFTPTAAEAAEAQALVAAFDAAGTPDADTCRLPDGRSVDRALAERARALLALYESSYGGEAAVRAR